MNQLFTSLSGAMIRVLQKPLGQDYAAKLG